MQKHIHTHKSISYQSKILLYLAIPIVVFGFLLSLYFITKEKAGNTQIATTADPSVLGEEETLNK